MPSFKKAGQRGPTPRRSCALDTLARGSVLHVQRCAECETLSLHFGPFTVRLDPAAAEGAWSVLGEALAVLREHLLADGRLANMRGAPHAGNA